jgi:membrane protein YdbS with pleckstrin-like domain
MKNKTVFPFWGFLPALVPIVLLVNLLCHNSEVFSRWLGFAYWALASLVVLCAVWMAYRTYLKWLEMQQEQELKIKKAGDEKTWPIA